MNGAYAGSITRAAVRPPRVIVVGPLPPPFHGGAMATWYVLESELASAADVLHLDTTDRRSLANIGTLDAHNVWLALRHAVALLWLLVTRRPDVVYVPLAQNTLGALRDLTFLLPALLLRRRVVVHLHGSGFRDFLAVAPAPLRLLLRAVLRRVERVIVLADALRPLLAGVVAGERVAVLPNGIPDPFGGFIDRSGRSGAVRVLYLGNLLRAKGFLDAIGAVHTLRERGVAVELDLAGSYGSDSDRDAATPLLQGLGAAARLHGVVDGSVKQALYESADVFVFPSHSEGHPYVVLEAMSAGLPVVATRLPGLGGTVIDGVTGRLVPVQAPDALADALQELVLDAETRLRFGRAGRQRYEERFTLGTWSGALRRIILDGVA